LDCMSGPATNSDRGTDADALSHLLCGHPTSAAMWRSQCHAPNASAPPKGPRFGKVGGLTGTHHTVCTAQSGRPVWAPANYVPQTAAVQRAVLKCHLHLGARLVAAHLAAACSGVAPMGADRGGGAPGSQPGGTIARRRRRMTRDTPVTVSPFDALAALAVTGVARATTAPSRVWSGSNNLPVVASCLLLVPVFVCLSL